jgi:DNA-directed RNA polymerase subunit E'/Rpb7
MSSDKNFLLHELVVTKSVQLHPSYLDKNILTTVKELFAKKYEKTCDEEFGLFIEVVKVVKSSNVISKDLKSINFTVEFLAKVAKPEINMIVNFTPTMIVTKGVFGKIHDNINFFIPESSLKGWAFDQENFKKGKKKITKNEMIEAIITDIRFETTKYNCICALK